jgi:hypothetical protein
MGGLSAQCVASLSFPNCRCEGGRGLLLWPVFSCQCRWLDFSGPNIIAGLIFGSIGFVAFTYGKRMNLWRPMFGGLALMVYPYFVANTVILFVVGIIGSAALFFLRE